MEQLTKTIAERVQMSEFILDEYKKSPSFVMELINDAIGNIDTSELTVEDTLFNMQDSELENVFNRITYLKSR